MEQSTLHVYNVILGYIYDCWEALGGCQDSIFGLVVL